MLVDNGFERTAYKRGNTWYPAPFGDLRDAPLDFNLQRSCEWATHKTCTIGIVTISVGADTVYTIKAQPIGMNIHVPKNDTVVKIAGGVPQGFIFYTGIENKYKDKDEEYKDCMDPKRLETVQSEADCD